MEYVQTISRLHVVIIDDDEDHAELTRVAVGAALRDAGVDLQFSEFSHPAQALEASTTERCLFMCDYKFASDTAAAWLPDLVDIDRGPAIVMTSCGHEDIAAAVFRRGATDYINKQTVFEQGDGLRHVILDALRRFNLEQTARELTRQLERANDDLRIKGDRLELLSNSAHRFVEDVAHEFRTPLAVIQEFASIMADGIGGPVSEKQCEFLDFIGNATRDLAQLVDDFLDSSKLRAGTLRVDRRAHDVHEIIDTCWTILQRRSQRRDITLVRDVPDELPLVWIDIDKARRTLTNLVVNAIKYAPTQTTVTVQAEVGDDHTVELRVIDEGPGMSELQREQLFERFRQGSATHDSNTKSFGLGLSIVRELTGINLGLAKVRSREGSGSTFSFSMPRADTDSIIRGYLAWIDRQEESTPITMLHVEALAPEMTQDDLQAFLGSVSRATDLALPVAEDGGVFLIGVGYRPQEWADRIQELYWESALRVLKQFDQPLRITVLGVRQLEDAESFLNDQLVHRVEIPSYG